MLARMTRNLALASLCAGTPVAAQTTAQDLPRANPDVTWPTGLDPSVAEIFNHNQLDMQQSCEVVFSWLSAPQDWPTWLIFATDVELAEPGAPLTVGSRFKWTIFGIPIEAEVYVAEPNRRLGYTVTPPGPPPLYAHSWLFTPNGTGCTVTTEEVGIGELARERTANGERLVYLAHELWLASLHFVARNGARVAN